MLQAPRSSDRPLQNHSFGRKSLAEVLFPLIIAFMFLFLLFHFVLNFTVALYTF